MSRSTLTQKSELYPRSLLALGRDAPEVLRLEGRLPRGTYVAIVGTRRADAAAFAFTRTLAHDLARAGAVVVSGGAVGIDEAAHEGALLAGAPTIAVLAGGLDRPYPPDNVGLFARVAQVGGLLSEAADLHVASSDDFLRRNRIVAALASVVIVVRAPYRSGALCTAAHAKRLNRPLFVVPGAPWDGTCLGNLRLLSNGATICTSAKDALSVAPLKDLEGLSPVLDLFESPPVFSHLDDESRSLLEAFDRSAHHVDGLTRALGWPVSKVRAKLLELELEGLIEEKADGSFALSAKVSSNHGQVPRHR